MELKPGYKQTEVGVIPEDWEVKKLGELGTIVRGGSPRPAGDPRYFNGNYIPWLTVAALTKLPDYRTEVYETAGFLTEAGSKLSRTLNAGTVIIANSGATLGVAKILRVTCCANDGIAAIIKQHHGNKQYICFFVNTLTKHLRDVVATGNGQPNLNTTLIRNILVPIPPEPEQTAIATALSDVDALLDSLDRLIVKKRGIKQAAMQQLLTGETRLPGFEGEWEEQLLGDHVAFLKNGVHSRAQLTQGDPVKNLHYGDIHASKHVQLEPTHLPSLPHVLAGNLGRLQDGDLVFADASEDLEGVGKSVEVFGCSGVELVAGLHTIAARFDKNVLVDGFKGYLQFCQPFASQLRRLAAGTKVYATNRKHIAGIKMRLPTTDEQVAIAQVLTDMDAEIAALEQRRAKTRDLKQAMMQELLTGRTRLVEPQASNEQANAAWGNAKGHNWAINEAVVIATLAKHFGGEDFPLGRKRYTKLSYLLHRHVERQAEGYLKKAAGPYNPKTKYGGPEKIAKQNGYIREHNGPKGHSGFIAADNIAQAEGYFEKWYGPEVIQWLEQFRFKKNDDLEVLATVDMAVVELRAAGKSVDVAAVKDVITSHPEWEAKLDRAAFSDANIAEAIEMSGELFSKEVEF